MLSDNEMDNLIKPEKGKKVKLKRVKLDRDKAKEKEEKIILENIQSIFLCWTSIICNRLWCSFICIK